MTETKPPREYTDSIYFVSDGGDSKDWFARIFKKDGDPWHVEYRFRYYKDDKSFDSSDTKDWYGMHAKDDSAKTLAGGREAIRAVQDVLMKLWGKHSDIVELQCYSDDPKFMFELGSRDWVSMQVIKEDTND